MQNRIYDEKENDHPNVKLLRGDMQNKIQEIENLIRNEEFRLRELEREVSIKIGYINGMKKILAILEKGVEEEEAIKK